MALRFNQACFFSLITSQTRGGLIGSAFVSVTPDSGSTVSTMTDGLAKLLQELCSKNPSAHNWKIKSVAEYSVELADSTLIKS